MPYFTVGVQAMVPRYQPGLGTMGATQHGHLLVDPELLAKLFVDEAATMVLHEYLHGYFNHHERFDEMVRKGLLESGDFELFNDAGDAEINDNLEAAACVFPREEVMGGPPVTPQLLGLPPHRTAEEYAVTLKKRGHKPKRPPKSRISRSSPSPTKTPSSPRKSLPPTIVPFTTTTVNWYR